MMNINLGPLLSQTKERLDIMNVWNECLLHTANNPCEKKGSSQFFLIEHIIEFLESYKPNVKEIHYGHNTVLHCCHSNARSTCIEMS